MAFSTLQKLLRNQTRPAWQILSHFRQPLPPFPLTQIPQISKPIGTISHHAETHCPQPNNSSNYFYPVFCFQFFPIPNSPTSLVRPEPDDGAARDDTNVIRADSVKKKRKRKMNKHKLKKLRKRLRRKT